MSRPRASKSSACRCVSPILSPIDQMPAAMPTVRVRRSALDLYAQTSVTLFRPAGAAFRTKRLVVSPDTEPGSDADLVFIEKHMHLTLPPPDALGSHHPNRPSPSAFDAARRTSRKTAQGRLDFQSRNR